MIDLHSHSTCSDGALPPAELLARAAAVGLRALALTDHDTVAGLEEAAAAARTHGVRLVPGIEFSAAWRSQSIHVLGLWIDPDAPALRAAVAAQLDRRRHRIRAICERLTHKGLPGDRLLAMVEARATLPTRSHLADALVEAGCVRDPQAAFRVHLGRGRAAHVAAEWPALAEIVGWIVAAGGTASLAHPTRYALSATARNALLADFVAAGGRALEIGCGGNAAHHVDACAALARRHGLEATVGSDFHGPRMPWNPLGRLAKLPDGLIPAWRSRGIGGDEDG
jgi:predicted metal-dependent phosphoesterase TrpH